MSKNENVMKLLQPWEYLGVMNNEFGDTIYGTVPGMNKKSYYHILLNKVPTELLEETIKENPALRNTRYVKELECNNGLKLFSGKLFFFGFNLKTSESGRPAFSVAWDIRLRNIGNKELREKFDGVVIGGQNISHTGELFIEQRQNKFIAVRLSDFTQTNEWESIEQLISDTIQMGNKAYGVKLNSIP
ncbi:MAG: hypothetical protein COA47_05845 [Robiginitomaculum sp.]|nr:MAG: hypothetical protein COA47_05845 [Robiginitomaculum sp.]